MILSDSRATGLVISLQKEIAKMIEEIEGIRIDMPTLGEIQQGQCLSLLPTAQKFERQEVRGGCSIFNKFLPVRN